MKPNPGGIIKGNAVVDRKNEIDSIWSTLENQSVVLISERRVGKTCVLRKMEENPKDDWQPVLYWVEGKEHPIDFVEGIYEKLLEKGLLKNNFHKLKKMYTKYVGGKHIGSWDLPQIRENWKTLLRSIVEDIVDSEHKVLVMLDELPLMLAKFIKTDGIGPLGTMTFLDFLRGLRTEFEASGKITFIFCGSIGIQLVIKGLKWNHGYNADPINNMRVISLSGMDEAGAYELCTALSENAPFTLDNKEKVFSHVCRETDRLPFYIQHVFKYFYRSKEPAATVQSVDRAIASLIDDKNDIGHFKHYVDRIKTYYSPEIRDIALLVLDRASRKDGFWQEDDIFRLVKSHLEVDDESIMDALGLIWSDHYVVRQVKDSERFYKFRYSLLKKWWDMNRGRG